VYSARTEGKSAHTSMGGGGQSCSRAGVVRRRAVLLVLVGTTGVEEGQDKSSGTSGEVVQRTRGVREATKVRGTSGKLNHACQGQRVGLSVSRALKRSLPMNSRTAKAP